jgi:hypothetical protein
MRCPRHNKAIVCGQALYALLPYAEIRRFECGCVLLIGREK